MRLKYALKTGVKNFLQESEKVLIKNPLTRTRAKEVRIGVNALIINDVMKFRTGINVLNVLLMCCPSSETETGFLFSFPFLKHMSFKTDFVIHHCLHEGLASISPPNTASA